MSLEVKTIRVKFHLNQTTKDFKKVVCNKQNKIKQNFFFKLWNNPFKKVS